MAEEPGSTEPSQLRFALELTQKQYAAINEGYGQTKGKLCCGCKGPMTSRKLIVTQPRTKWSWHDSRRMYVFYFCENCTDDIQGFFTGLMEKKDGRGKEQSAADAPQPKRKPWPTSKGTGRTRKVRGRGTGRS